ncbi:MAG TPA: response regulator [Acidobacteriota bacterium]
MAKPARILVVDDEADLVETIRFRLEQEGHQVLTAVDGLQGLATARSEQPDLIVLDVMMPGENGYRVAHQLREDEAAGRIQRRPRIILLTARDLRSEPEREQTFMEFSQADLMLYKPFDLEELTQRIHELLAA